MFSNHFLLSLPLLVAVFATTAADDSKSCDLECPTNAPCRFGHADFSGRVNGGIESASHLDGMHCDCPMGWTGVMCNQKYETCSHQHGHECYNGGECILGLQDIFGNDQLFCDCSKADGYVGKFCETPFEQKCSSSKGKHMENHNQSQRDHAYCVNGAVCNPNFPETSSQPCFCGEGWEGLHCEFAKETVPECTLHCFNDGVCVLGPDGSNSSSKAAAKTNHPTDEQHMSCVCSSDFSGRFCEAPVEQCGNDDDDTSGNGHVCLNGGKCVTTSAQTSEGKVHSQHHCDCTMASNEKNDRFAGKYCEHEATSLCSDNDWNLFCTQGGSCKENPIEGCSCLNGTTGYKCEFILDGFDMDASSAIQDSSSNNNNNSNSSSRNTTGKDTASSDQNISSNDKNLCVNGNCLNGGHCVREKISLADGTEAIEEHCDCSKAFDQTYNYAGPYCQYKSTSLCFVQKENSVEETFCTNDGTCQTDGSCDCPTGWTGKHCQVKNQQEIGCANGHCLNGGHCVTETTSLTDGTQAIEEHCDCSKAFDETFNYAGPYCQYKSTSLCFVQTENSVEETFCTHDGTCQTDGSCDCPTGWTGKYCQVKTKQKIACAADYCLNGGHCVTETIFLADGTKAMEEHCDCSKAFDATSNYAGPYCEYKSTSLCFVQNGNSVEETFCTHNGTCQKDGSCNCPTGWTGQYCEVATLELNAADDNSSNNKSEKDATSSDQNFSSNNENLCVEGHCLNGGHCVREKISLADGTEAIEEHCDCSKAFDETFNYAGPYCQYKSTSLCFVQKENSVEETFCTNDGTCQKDGSCDCPTGWTGKYCQVKTKQEIGCANGHCLNGGHCVAETTFLADGTEAIEEHCDCSKAFDAISNYAGPYCQYKSTSLCFVEHTDLVEETFCVHNGACQKDGSCDCPMGWTGKYCQVKNKQKIACADNYCLNGGHCVTEAVFLADGTKAMEEHCDCSKAFDATSNYAGPYCQYKSTSLCFAELEDSVEETFCTHNGTCQKDGSCNCPTGWTGQYCELKTLEFSVSDDNKESLVEAEACGDTICYNGGKCVSSGQRQSNGDLVVHNYCDCTAAFDEKHLYAGESCEFPSTQVCSSPQDTKGLEGSSFCVNHGTCMYDIKLGCDCQQGFYGYSCEYESRSNKGDDTECNLNCKNGGMCAQGAKDLGSLRDIIVDVGHLNQTHAEDQFAHCVCSEGWVGLTCETKIEICGEDQHTCLHGSKCTPDPTKNRGYSCDCSQADVSVGDNYEMRVYAGDYCQYFGTDICTIGDDYPGQPLYFCVNDGKCNAWVARGEPDPGCTCTDKYTGPHCEVNIAVAKKREADSKRNNGNVIVTVVLTLLGVVGLVGLGVCFRMISKKGSAATATTDNPKSSNIRWPFPRRRRRKAGFTKFARPSTSETPNSVADLPSHPFDASDVNPVILDYDDDRNDGIMNDDVQDKSQGQCHDDKDAMFEIDENDLHDDSNLV